jgi:pimeloyl-ACP methyl ester carboxylesterase
MSVILLDKEIVHYEVLGRGRPVIFLHDWIGSWRYWVPAMQAVSIAYRAYALDMWGFGDTAKNKAHYSTDQQVSLLNNFLEQLGVARVVLVGHGLGALVALLYVQRHPQSVDRLLLVSSAMHENALNARFRSSSPLELADWLAGRSPEGEPVRSDAAKTDAEAIQNSVKGLPAAGLQKLAMALSAACLYVYGQNDPAVEIPRLDEQASLPEQSHIIIFDQSGHFPMLDETSKFNRLVIDFLALTSGASPRDLLLKEEWKRRVR